MKRPLFIKNAPIDEKRISFIEDMILRLTRRTHKVAKSIIPPQVISTHIKGNDLSGDILHHMFFKGNITKSIIQFNKKPKSPIHIKLEYLDGTVGGSKSIYVDKQKMFIDLDIKTSDGTTMIISSTNTDEDITDLWISLLWISHMSRAKIRQHLIDELDNVSNGNISEEE